MDEKNDKAAAPRRRRKTNATPSERPMALHQIDDPFAVFIEWTGEGDTLAYAELSRVLK